MDLRTDPNLMPYMAVTAHWLQVTDVNTATGSRKKLIFRCDLIGFHCVPTRHTGEHLAGVFLWYLDRLDISTKVCALFYFFGILFIYYNIQIR